MKIIPEQRSNADEAGDEDMSQHHSVPANTAPWLTLGANVYYRPSGLKPFKPPQPPPVSYADHT